MSKRIDELVEGIKKLERELKDEVSKIRIETYEIRDRTVQFRDDVRRYHKTRVVPLLTYLRGAKLKHFLIVPVIWFCIFPALFMDLVVSIYQAICFPVFGIPKVRRSDHVIIDRHFLAYLNVVEKINCVFCGYFGGVMAFATEVAARTEQYWCPIKHASHLKNPHSRYTKFVDYDDSDQYRLNADRIREDFDDLKQDA